jgi:hypothetical protein
MIRLQSLTNAKLIALLATASVMTSCGVLNPDQNITAAPPSSGASVAFADKISPITAKAGQTLQVSGKDFSESAGLRARFTLADGSSKDAPLKVASATSASFVMPDGVGLGLKSMKIIQGKDREVSSFSLVANTAENSLPIIIDDQSEICSTKTYIDRNGDQKTGTKNCPQACVEDGASNCVVDGTAYKAAKLANLTPGSILDGVTIAGVQGQLTTNPAACNSSGQQACVAGGSYYAGTICPANGSGCYLPAYVPTTQSLKAINYDAINTNKSAIRSGVTLGGVGGNLLDCTTNAATGCVTTSTYKSFDLTNLSAGNIKSGVTIAGITGNLVNPDPWDLRVGKMVNGIAGKLKTTCRNRVNPDIYNYDGQISGINGGANLEVSADHDIWDTIDDYNGNISNGFPHYVVDSWNSNTDCGGNEIDAGDANVWKDVTTTNGSTASSCAATPANCTKQDKITGLYWSKEYTSVFGGWPGAWSHCFNLTHNGQAGWRLPTHKEMLEAYAHGIYSAQDISWIWGYNMMQNIWSGSSYSQDTTKGWAVSLARGSSTDLSKGFYLHVVCVK